MEKINRRRFLGSAAGGIAGAALAVDRLPAEDVKSTAGTGKVASSRMGKIAAARYAPDGKYMKDHSFIYKDGQWHLFAPLGNIGTIWQHPGSEETAEHMLSSDLVHWKHLGTAVAASGREGYFDKTMGGIAPNVIQHNGTYFMFYSGWTFPSKHPKLDLTGCRQSIGLATSRDLNHWEIPEEFAKNGLGVLGTDCCVVRDDSGGRWLMYTWTGQTPVYQSHDLRHWSQAGTALTKADYRRRQGTGGPGESPFVMRHPRSGKWIICFNGGYSVSDDPLKFPPIQPYPFKSGWNRPRDVRTTAAWGKGTRLQADDDGAGYAHEILEFSGQWYMSGVVGRDGSEKLKFTPIEWTEDSIRLAK